MAPTLALVVLACAAIAVCNAEAPFRGYSSRQEAAPYPASGFRPDRTFDLPTAEAIAQQLRVAQIKKLQQEYQQQLQFQQFQQFQRQQKQRQQQQQQQQTPSQLYGAPSESELSPAQLPQRPSGLYGAPQEDASSFQPSDFTRPQQPSQQYGAPEESASQLREQFLRPQQQTSQRQIQFQRQQQPSRQYGAPLSKQPIVPESTSDESLEESKDVESVAQLNKESGRLTQGNQQQRDTENDETETATKTASVLPGGFVLVPVATVPTGFTAQKLALLPAGAAQATLAKLQYPHIISVQQQKLIAAPQIVAQQSYYQPQQLAYTTPLQAW